MRPDEFSRCAERIQESDLEKAPSPMARTDTSLKASVERAIWKDEVLRAIEYQTLGAQTTDATHRFAELMEESGSFKEPFVVNDALGSSL